MRHGKLLDSARALLLVIDIQEAFLPHIFEMDRVIARSRIMMEAAGLLGLPVIVSEQYPKALGKTVEPLRAVAGAAAFYEKFTFSCCQEEALLAAITATGRSQIIMVGIETHVCVLQTAYDLQAIGLRPYLMADAVSSRRQSDMDAALRRMMHEGTLVTTTEAAIMEMTVTSKHPQFKLISKLIK